MNQFYFPCMNPMYMQKQIPIPGGIKITISRAFIPDQPYIKMFPLDEALQKGTLFPNLYVPYPIKSLE